MEEKIKDYEKYSWREYDITDNIYIPTHWLNKLTNDGCKPEHIKITDTKIFYYSDKCIL